MNLERVVQLKKYLDENPNDMELGKLVRQLYNQKTSETKWM